MKYDDLLHFDPNLSIWIADAPQALLDVLDEVARSIVLKDHPNYIRIHETIHVRIANHPVVDKIRDIRQVSSQNSVA